MSVLLSSLFYAAVVEIERVGGVSEGLLKVEILGPDGTRIVQERIYRRLEKMSAALEQLSVSEPNSANHEPHRGKMFSPIEDAIMRAASTDWQSSAELAAKTGQKVGHWFYAILGNLVDREWLESGRNGYRKPAAPASSTA